jgi:hypothetical protein
LKAIHQINKITEKDGLQAVHVEFLQPRYTQLEEIIDKLALAMHRPPRVFVIVLAASR